MAKAASKILFILWVLSFYAAAAAGEGMKSHFNGLVLDTDKEVEEFSFLLAGHMYGSHNESIYPSASLLANIQLLNNSGAHFLVSLGDIVQQANELQIEVLKTSFLLKLNLPVFHTPGNHDFRSRYIEYFGNPFFSFRYGSSFFIFLNSEASRGKIEGEQLDFLIKDIEYCKKTREIQNIFIFSHRLLWAIENPPYSEIIRFVNGPGDHPKDAATISKVILPKLKSLVDKNVYFAGGDVGCKWSLPLFYEKDPKSNITYIAVGVGDTEKDVVLQAHLSKSGKATFTPISLTTQKLYPVEYYSLDYWKSYFKKKAAAKAKKDSGK